ncbi:PREDICTED: protein KTI12 homolog [Priapulus caudatus]|uniref:Protein KTI12 homolog n=1 Tax=Priapulus caudatus TaxID=37621 RepID=A0ABM1DRP4_PRICU|nr:PREDICTED: protein KTI12 homolog [Priapulus caudatus]
MPLVIFCGFPSSGKSSRAAELQQYLFREHPENCVHLISDHTLGVDRNLVFADARQEKEHRAALKAAVQRTIDRHAVVILDSLNYIKGFRYELFCVAKAAQTPSCVVHCDAAETVAAAWNGARAEAERYDDDILHNIVARFETPDGRHRWDSPLFSVHPGDAMQCHLICDALLQRKAPPPNMATQSQPLSSTNFVYELDRVTQGIVACVLDSQKTSVVGDSVHVPSSEEKVELVKTMSMAELRGHRRRFISYTKTHPMDINKIGPAFVQFLNNSIR